MLEKQEQENQEQKKQMQMLEKQMQEMQLEENRKICSQKVKLILSDMDGTLLKHDKTISEVNRAAIHRLKESNLLFSICTGRIPGMMQYYIERLELETPIVAVNGAIIWNPKNEKAIFDIPMNEGETMELMEFCKFHQMDYCALSLEDNYFSKNSIRIQRFEQYNDTARRNGLREIPLSFFDEGHHCVRGKKIYKMLIYELIPGELSKAENFLKNLKETGYTSSEKGLWDISDQRVNKGFGLEKLTDYLRLEKSQVCAIGDYYNDVPMLESSGFAVAMENGCQEAKDRAVYITKSNEEDGVACVIQKYFLKKDAHDGGKDEN